MSVLVTLGVSVFLTPQCYCGCSTGFLQNPDGLLTLASSRLAWNTHWKHLRLRDLSPLHDKEF